MFDVGKYIWIKDENYSFIPGKITSIEDGQYQILIQMNGEEEVRVISSNKEYIEVDPNCLAGVDDLLSLGDFDEQTLLHNTRTRYNEDKIYSFIGMPILIAVNPYKKLNIYENKVIKSYKDYFEKIKTDPASAGLPKPHLFHLAEAAYRDMLEDKKNQSLIISGESGSGKTESTKIILKYLATSSLSTTNSSTDKNDNKVTVEDQVLESNPLLEAFGNAKTVKNNNSSRFGKFIQVSFTEHGKILSAKIFNYLLEKSRIVKIGKGERNYHIFYQIIKGANEEEKEKYRIEDIESYYYLNNGTYDNDDMDDAEEFQNTKNCMKKLKFTDDEIDQIFRIVMGVMNLGNINFEEYQENNVTKSKITEDSYEYWENASYLLGVEKDDLLKILTTQNFLNPENKKYILRFKDENASYNSLNALSKALYSKMFNFIVMKTNEAIQNNTNIKCNEKNITKIGILDIFGFENFENNSFEQLCINYANERLQQFFNNHIFKLEQEEYKREGIDWTQVSFVDNKEIIDLIENGKLSIFGFLDDVGNLKGTDKSFRDKVYQYLKKNNQRLINKNDDNLIIEHYAGQIIYKVINFVEKNLDSLTSNIGETLCNSKNLLVKKLFEKPVQKGNKKEGLKPGKLHQDSISKQFKLQLDELLVMLNQSNPRYVKCIKPNSEKKPSILESNDVLEQLKSAGVLEAIKIRKQGYSIRRTKEEFFNFYHILTPEIDPKANCVDMNDAINKMMKILLNIPEMIQTMKGKKKMIQVGHSKVFMKEEIKAILDYKRNRIKYIYLLQSYHRAEKVRRKIEKYLNFVSLIQATFKMYLYKSFFKGFRESCIIIQKKIRICSLKKKTNYLIKKLDERKQERLERERQRKLKELEELRRLEEIKKLEQELKQNPSTSEKLVDDRKINLDGQLDKEKNINYNNYENIKLGGNDEINNNYNSSRTGINEMQLFMQENNRRKVNILNNNFSLQEDGDSSLAKNNEISPNNKNNTKSVKKKKKKKKEKSSNKDLNLLGDGLNIDSHLKDKLLDLTKELEETKNERDSLKIELERKNKELENLKNLNNIDSLDKDDSNNNVSNSEIVKKLKKELSDKDTNYYILNMQMEELKKQKSNLDEVTESLKNQHQKRIEKYNQEINDLHEQINDLQKAKQDYEIKLGGQNDDFNKKQNYDEDTFKELSNLRYENKNLQKKLDDTKHKLNKEISELKTKIEQGNLKAKENVVDKELFINMKDDYDKMKIKNIELSKKLEVFENSKNANDSIKSQYESKLQEKISQMNEINNKNEEAYNKIDKFEKIEKVLRAQLLDKEKEIEMFKKFSEDTRKENEKISDENMALKKENYSMKSKLDLLDTKQKNKIDSDMNKLKGEVENYKKQISDFENDNEKLKKSLKNKSNNLKSKMAMNLLLVDLVKIQKDEIKLMDVFNLTHSEKVKANLQQIKEENAKIIAKLNEAAKNDNENEESEEDDDEEQDEENDDNEDEEDEEENGEGEGEEEEESEEGDEEEEEEEKGEENEKNESKQVKQLNDDKGNTGEKEENEGGEDDEEEEEEDDEGSEEEKEET